MVVHTVTLDTAFDDHFAVSGWDADELGRVTGYSSTPSGKGITCARVGRALGLPMQVHALIGTVDRREVEARLAAEGLSCALLPVPGPTGHNLTIEGPEGQVTRAVGTGFDLRDPRPALHLVDQVVAAAVAGDIVTLNGPVPHGVPSALWASAAARLLANDVQVIVDTSDDALVACLQIRDLIAVTPDTDEIALVAGQGSERLDTGSVLNRLARSAVQLPLVTLGSDGVAWRDHHGINYRSWCPVDHPVAHVGAGDAFVAGLVAGMQGSTSHKAWITAAVAVASAYVAGVDGAQLGAAAQQNLTRVQTEPLSSSAASH